MQNLSLDALSRVGQMAVSEQASSSSISGCALGKVGRLSPFVRKRRTKPSETNQKQSATRYRNGRIRLAASVHCSPRNHILIDYKRLRRLHTQAVFVFRCSNEVFNLRRAIQIAFFNLLRAETGHHHHVGPLLSARKRKLLAVFGPRKSKHVIRRKLG